MTTIGPLKLFAPALVSVTIVVAAGPTTYIQTRQVMPAAPSGLARDIIGPASALTVTSTAFKAGESIPAKYSDYGDKVSPPFAWTGQPIATKSFAIVVDDPDAKAPAPSPYVHWVLYNLPSTFSSLPEGIAKGPQLVDRVNARQGKSSQGGLGYFGPRPPAADPAHHYHFQVFAVNAVLDLLPGVDRAALLTALKGHVVAHGEIVGTFAAPVDAR